MEGVLQTCRICGGLSQSRLGWRVAAQPAVTRERLAVSASALGNGDNQSTRQRKVRSVEVKLRALYTMANLVYLFATTLSKCPC